MHPTPRPNRVLRALTRTLLLLVWANPALAGELPEATLQVRGKSLILQVTPPAGEHINEEAPARYQVGAMELAGPGVLTDARLPWSPAAEARAVALELPLCQTSSDQTRAQCRIVSLTTTLAPGELRGKVQLTAPAPPTPPRANDFGAVVQIYDFSAVWCPPCNQMKVEVLEDPTNAADLAGLQITVVDVDRPESWPLKSRYTVGGYPTLIAVDAQGQERSRFLGYPNEAALLAWLGGLREAEPMERVRQGPLADCPPEKAARTALQLAEAGEKEAALRWLAAAAPGTLSFHHARLLLDPRPEDVEAMVAGAAPGPWILSALEAAPARWPALKPLIAQMAPLDAAAVFSLRAEQTPAEAEAAHLAARLLVEGSLTGDPEVDRAQVTWLASLRATAGDLPAALSLLDTYAGHYPDEFTFFHAKAGLLVQAGRFAEAEPVARTALAVAFGDQRLRAVIPLAQALREQGRRDEALAALRAELAAGPVPGPGDQVRTVRYRAAVDAEIAKLSH